MRSLESSLNLPAAIFLKIFSSSIIDDARSASPLFRVKTIVGKNDGVTGSFAYHHLRILLILKIIFRFAA